MTPLMYMIALIASIGILLVLTIKLKINSFMALFFTSIALGVFFGQSFTDTLAQVSTGFGSTLGSIGLTVLFGAVLAMGVQDSGGAVSVTNFFIRKFRGKRLELAPVLTAFVIAISVFGDVAQLLTAPIAATIAKRKNLNMTIVTSYIIPAVWFTHGVVPPSAGILAIAIMLQADVGMTILWGLILCFIALLLTYALTIKWMTKHASYAEPKPEFTVGIEPAPDDASLEDLLIKDSNAPNALVAFLPLLVPAALITLNSLCTMILPEGSIILSITAILGDKAIAMLCGIVILIVTNLTRKKHMLQVANRSQSISENANVFELGFGNWVDRAIKISGMVLLVTAMGGAFSSVLKSQPVVSQIADVISKSGIPMLLIPFIISAVMRAAAGSMVTAGMTAAGICIPLMDMLGLSPVAVTLAIGFGTMMFGHVNDSGCWMCQEVFNVNLSQYLKYVSPMAMIGSLIGFLLLMGCSAIGII
ncbi:MAG: GntP family permease [Oscillospiraceae bacterium]